MAPLTSSISSRKAQRLARRPASLRSILTRDA